MPRDLWNPDGVDRLLNEELHRAIEAAAAEPTPENRRRGDQLLLGVVYCVPSTGGAAGTLGPSLGGRARTNWMALRKRHEGRDEGAH